MELTTTKTVSLPQVSRSSVSDKPTTTEPWEEGGGGGSTEGGVVSVCLRRPAQPDTWTV